jgi:hypothetical protein
MRSHAYREREIINVCCMCEPDDKRDDESLVLVSRECPKHGRTWHRPMIKRADGSLEFRRTELREPQLK